MQTNVILAGAAVISLGGVASLAQQAGNMTFFITSHGSGKGGDLGGLRGADAHCQALAKAMFNHHAFRDRVRLSGVNSINWARIAAQVVYYFTAAVALGAPHRKVAFTVPTGNFGDIYAGYVALRMGLPIDRLVIATNVNDILPRTLASGAYELREVVPTASPSMDIQVASNFERILFEVYDRDAAAVRALMGSLAQSRRFVLSAAALSRLRATFSAGRADADETAAAIRTVLRESGHFIDPHTAVGIGAARRLSERSQVPMIVLGTAHPAKFPAAIESATGINPALPPQFSDLFNRKEQFDVLPNDAAALETYIRQRRSGAKRAAS